MVAANNRIAATISDTALTALFELIQVPHEHLIWENFSMVDNVLIILATITYDPAHELSPFLANAVPNTPGTTPIQVQRTLQFAMPLDILFSPKDEIKTWLMNAVTGAGPSTIPTHTPPAAPTTDSTEFDRTTLSKEQLAQLLFFNTMLGEKQ